MKVVSEGSQLFSAVLVQDVSRFGRFQKLSTFHLHEDELRLGGVELIECDEHSDERRRFNLASESMSRDPEIAALVKDAGGWEVALEADSALRRRIVHEVRAIKRLLPEMPRDNR